MLESLRSSPREDDGAALRVALGASAPASAPRRDAPSPLEPGSERLPSPAELRARLPRSPRVSATVARGRRTIRDVLHGRDRHRLVVVAGPCPLHDRGSALEYARRLAELERRHRDDLVVVMRTYFEKPRSAEGWKGWINDPHLDESFDVAGGIESARSLLLEIGALRLPCATEILDPIACRFLDDLLAWAAIGARTVESQAHRELASGLGMPVGMKNNLAGDVAAAANAARVVGSAQVGLGIDHDGRAAVVRSTGNPDAHVVLRGSERASNHGPDDVREAIRLAAPLGLARPVFVDCSHGNSGKDHTRQAAVCGDVLAQVRSGRTPIGGLLLESHLEPGRQEARPGRRPEPERSITDACIGWEETARLVSEAADAVRSNRSARSAG